MVCHLLLVKGHSCVIYAPVTVKVVRHIAFLHSDVLISGVEPASTVLAQDVVGFALHCMPPLGSHVNRHSLFS